MVTLDSIHGHRLSNWSFTIAFIAAVACNGNDLDAPANFSTSFGDGGGTGGVVEDSGAVDETGGVDETGFPMIEEPCQMAGMFGTYDAHFESSRYLIEVDNDCGPVDVLWQEGPGTKLNGESIGY
jgi:hypothetical protein